MPQGENEDAAGQRTEQGKESFRRWAKSLGVTSKNLGTLGVAGLVLGSGLLLTYLVVEVIGISGAAVAIACLVLPVLVALALSGRLTEISAGGFSAKFQQATRGPVTAAVTNAAVAGLSLRKGPPDALIAWIAQQPSDHEAPVILSVQLGDEIDLHTLHLYVERLLQEFPNFYFVAIIDGFGAHIAHFNPRVLLRLVGGASELGNEFPLAISESTNPIVALQRLLRMGAQLAAINERAPMSAALGLMRDSKTDRLLTLDWRGRPSGVLDRSAAVSDVVLTLTE